MDNYFEGYYFKLTNNEDTLCFIVGYTLGENSHSFIQVFGSSMVKMYYFRFEILMCTMMRNPLYIRINDNIFTKNKVVINLENDEITIKGVARFEGQVSLIKSGYTPSIMGPLTYIRAKCIHDIVTIYSRANGAFKIRNRTIVFNDAFAYIEGDRGSSFPETYIWLQALDEDFSIFLSIALVDIEWFRFKGGIATIHHGSKQFRFGSYYLARVEIFKNEESVIISIKQGSYSLLVTISNYDDSTLLMAPENGLMNGVTRECVDATISFCLFKDGRCIVSKEGLMASVELKNIDELM